jgi:hypothetical protein
MVSINVLRNNDGINSLAKGIVVRSHIRSISTVGNNGDLSLSSLGLLAAAHGSLLLLHLLIAESCESAGNLLDLVARQLLCQLLGELLEEERVVSLLCRAGDDRSERLAESGELCLGGGVEEWEIGDVHGVVRVVRVDNHSSTNGSALAVVANANTTEEILGMSQVGVLLGATKTLATLGGSFVLLIAEETLLLALKSTLGLVLGDTLSFGLLVGGSFGISLGLGLGSLLCLLAFYLGVFSGVPGVENLRGKGAGQPRGGLSTAARYCPVGKEGEAEARDLHHCHPLRPRRRDGAEQQ